MLTEEEKKCLSDFEKEIGLPKNFYYNLLQDDDWSFVIKIHSLIEATITYSLSESLKIAYSEYYPEGSINLDKFISRLDTSDKETGKLAFLKGLDILYSDYRGFIFHLSEMRNKMIHNVKNVGMSIKKYVESLVTQKREDFIEKMTFAVISNISLNEKKLNKSDLFQNDPKLVIWYNTFQCISELYFLVKAFKLNKKLRVVEAEMLTRQKEVFDKLKPIMTKIIKSKNT